MTPLERAARVLCEIAGNDPDEVCIGEGKATGRTWMGWEAYVSDARKVIGAIRDHFEHVADMQQGACEAAASEQAAIAVGETHAIIDALDALLEEGE